MLATRRPGAGEPDWRDRLLVAYASAVFRIWYDDYMHGTLTEPLDHLDELLRTIESGVGSRT